MMGAVKQHFHDEICGMMDMDQYEPDPIAEHVAMMAHDAAASVARLAETAKHEPELVRAELSELRNAIKQLEATI